MSRELGPFKKLHHDRRALWTRLWGQSPGLQDLCATSCHWHNVLFEQRAVLSLWLRNLLAGATTSDPAITAGAHLPDVDLSRYPEAFAGNFVSEVHLPLAFGLPMI